MANIAFDFLASSFLFDERYIDDEYRIVPEKELVLELNKYHDYIEHNFVQIVSEVQSGNEMNVSIEAIDDLPDEQLLKQLALYLDKVIISDPIFEIALHENTSQMPIGELMHLDMEKNINRRKLAYVAKYMKWSTPLVARQFIKYVPIALLHEAPRKLPILYSKDGFASELSKELYQFFYDRVRVNNVHINDGKMTYSLNEKLQLGTTIAVDFDDENRRHGHIFQFMQMQKVNFDETTGRFEMCQYIPDTISESSFRAWVSQSINQAAIGEFRKTFREVMLAKEMQCMYLVKTKFTEELLNKSLAKKSVDIDLANLSMNLELPVVNKIALQDLISIRYDNGEAFHNFRTSLNAKLIELRNIDDKETLAKELQRVSYEMNTINVAEVNKEYKKIARTLGLDAVLLTGSLVTSYCTGGLTLIGAAGAIMKGSVDYIKYLNQVKENNGYFIWKLNKSI
ncbi:hypothetical protein D7V90_23145 [bacterium 1xD42-87]|nr:hypothetical protein D7V90_23145 [bacterium 1xD42-87]